jgi:hypothetical protein
MNVPGFTAEASLNKAQRQSHRHHQVAVYSASLHEVNLIQPQQGCDAFLMSVCMPVLWPCAYHGCWWNMGCAWGRGACTGCMDACIDAHTWFDIQGGALARICKTCARSWPCAC